MSSSYIDICAISQTSKITKWLSNAQFGSNSVNFGRNVSSDIGLQLASSEECRHGGPPSDANRFSQLTLIRINFACREF